MEKDDDLKSLVASRGVLCSSTEYAFINVQNQRASKQAVGEKMVRELGGREASLSLISKEFRLS